MEHQKIIFYVGNFNKPEVNAAGKRVYGNALVLSSIGYYVILIGKSKDKVLLGNPVSYGERIKFYSFPDVNVVNTKEYIKYIEVVKRMEGIPEIIIRYGSPGLAIFDKVLLKHFRKQNIKIIADVVDWLTPDGRNIIFNSIKSCDTYMEKAIFNAKSDGVIAISSYLGNYYKKKVKNVVVIPPIVQEYKKNTANNDIVNIMYAGEPFRTGIKVKDVHKIKDRLDIAVEALYEVYRRGIGNFRFDIYGITKEQYLVAFPEHKAIIDNSSEVIYFNGKKPMAEIQAKLTRSDFSILLRDVTRVL